MLNQFVGIGRLTSNIEVIREEGKEKATITIAIPRSYKNENGVYDTDFIKCTLWNGIAQNTAEYCKKGDIVGVKGRIQKSTNSNDLELVAEKITFLSSRQNNNDNL